MRNECRQRNWRIYNMQKVLKKRVWREFKENIWRYLALIVLVTLGMYLIVSMVGAADTVIQGVENVAEESRLEDGEFRVFVPLTNSQERELRGKGISLEKNFYLDFEQKDKSILRVYKNREEINLISLDEGRLAENENEVVLEKRYSAVHGILVGEKVTIDKKEFQVVGIGSTSDYDAPFNNFSDGIVDSEQFGTVFVTDKAYAKLKKGGNSVKTEEYIYSYRLNDSMTNEELKDWLTDVKVWPDKVKDTYFQEYWDEMVGDKEDLEEGIRELLSGAKDLKKGLGKLQSHSGELNDGAGQVFEAYLKQANESLSEAGLKQELTEDNFEQVLGSLKRNAESPIFSMTIGSLIDQLRELKSYKEGVAEYTDGVAEAKKGSKELVEGVQELKDGSDELMDTYFDEDISNLTMFLKVEDNPRVKASADDQAITRMAGLIAGIIVMILFTYVISVFVIHGIEKESSIIGTLYAMGAEKRDLMFHYLTMPVLVTFFAGIIGSVIGFSRWGIRTQMGNCYDYFSVPEFSTMYSIYLILYGVVMPPIIALIVNCFVIHKRLSKPALKLIQNEKDNSKVSNINLGKMKFINRFRVRQMLREMRTGLTVIFGMFICLLIMMLAVNCAVLCQNISKENKEDTKYEYMYTYKFPTQKVPEGGEACFVKGMKKMCYGTNMDVSLCGIDSDNPYFDAKVSESMNKVVVSSSIAERFHVSVGDKFIVSDEESDHDYVFTVEGITQFSTSFYVFMDIDSMRELMGEGEDYYNMVLSDQELEIESGRLYATKTREEINESSGVFVEMMKPMVSMLISVSIIIFFVVMYLMMKVMIDRSAFGISLIKVFGYRKGEIRKLYLNGNFYIVAVGAAICIPIAKLLMDEMFPMMISNISCGMNLSFSWHLYALIYISILAMYFVINYLLMRRINRIVPAEVLKNRE